jgi:hypothetical protein
MTETVKAPVPTDAALRALVTGLARPHRSGGQVIERASLLASGADFRAAVTWIEAHGGTSEVALPRPGRSSGGLHSARQAPADPTPLRFVLPSGALLAD